MNFAGFVSGLKGQKRSIKFLFEDTEENEGNYNDTSFEIDNADSYHNEFSDLTGYFMDESGYVNF